MHRIDSVDFFYLAMPEIRDIGDGSQDALLVRVRSGNDEGWGECEASPGSGEQQPELATANMPLWNLGKILKHNMEVTPDGSQTAAIRTSAGVVCCNTAGLLSVSHPVVAWTGDLVDVDVPADFGRYIHPVGHPIGVNDYNAADLL